MVSADNTIYSSKPKLYIILGLGSLMVSALGLEAEGLGFENR